MPPLPQWRWRTFPVFAGFAVGGFIGSYIGGIVGATNEGALGYVFVAFAALLGLTLSRIMVRAMMARRWVRPRQRTRT